METTERKTLDQFIEEHGLTMRATASDRNPNNTDSDWAKTADHWRCIIRNGARRMVTSFSMGSGHGGKEPTLADVLNSLALDSSAIENARSFEEWCDEFGYDHDSRKAERTYKVCQRQAARLKALLGDDPYKQLLWDTESL